LAGGLIGGQFESGTPLPRFPGRIIASPLYLESIGLQRGGNVYLLVINLRNDLS
jgi:hypothetical protein